MDIKELQKAILLTQNGQIKEAESIYKKLISENDENPMLLSAFGLFYVAQKDFSNAEKYLERACQLKETLGTVSALGFAKYEQKKYADAINILLHALNINENPDIYNKLILSFFNLKDYTNAVKYAGIMYEKYPENVNSISNMVKALTNCGELARAESICVNYLKDHNDAGTLWIHLGFLKELIYSDDKQALECFRIASELGFVDGFYNMGVSYAKQNNFENAEKCYKKMLELLPEDNTTIVSLGMCYLKQKRLKEGYELFYKRENHWNCRLIKKNEPLEKEVTIICDQGFGDHIQFSRYLSILKNKVDKIYLAGKESLRNLFTKNFPFVEYIRYEEINPQIQSIRISDLAYILDLDFDKIPFSGGYLDSETIDINSDKIKVGLCWEAGSAGIRTMINRTINVDLLEPIINLENTQIYSFQYTDTFNGNEKYPQMINLAKDFKNFDDTAKALKAMDIVVTVDTSVAHLAGALGVKTYLMLPYSSDWRWFMDTKKTPWYDSVEIFKQEDSISWEKPIKNIIEGIKNSEHVK